MRYPLPALRRARGFGLVRLGRAGNAAAKQVKSQKLDHDHDVGEQARILEPCREPGVLAIVGVEFAHRHDALPLGYRHDDLTAAILAEFAHGLRGLVLADWAGNRRRAA